ncbi:MAG: response regulator [Chloroflexi bacterium]|nr:response regulator [Chloroflexota bacterium]
MTRIGRDGQLQQVHSHERGNGTASAEMRPAILIVDDDPELRRLISLILGDRYQVLEANNADEAIRVLDRSAFGPAGSQIKVVLLDIMMPGMDGITLCRRIKKEFGVPVIMCTARVTKGDVQAALRNGADDYLAKPFDHQTLITRVARYT